MAKRVLARSVAITSVAIALGALISFGASSPAWAQIDVANGDVEDQPVPTASWGVEQDPLADDIADHVYSTNHAVDAVEDESAMDQGWNGDPWYDPADPGMVPF